MNQRDVAVAFRLNLLQELAAHGYGNVPVIEARQPRKQGRVADGIYYQMIMPKNYGWQARRYKPVDDLAGHTEHQLYEVTMQLTCIVNNDDVTGYNSSDLAAVVQMLCNGLPFTQRLRRDKIGVQRASSIRTVDFTDEYDDYAVEASFDVKVTFMRSIAPTTPIIIDNQIEILEI